jgi:hypothetical protein
VGRSAVHVARPDPRNRNAKAMLKVFLTVDVEVWCGGWDALERNFPEAFRRYIYGPTRSGNFALPYLLELVTSHGLQGVFFVEPLFAARFGAAPLAEVVGLIQDMRQEVQLHLHTEWADEARQRLLPHVRDKRQHLRHFARADQVTLLRAGKALLEQAGAPAPTAFRAGSFGFNLDTLSALREVGIRCDSSYNATLMGMDSGLMPGTVVCEPLCHDGLHEYPMTVYRDRPGHLRHAQIGACSFRELEGLLWQALEQRRRAFVILSHNFETLNRRKDAPDGVAVGRHRALCRFLDRNRDAFQTCGFRDLVPASAASQPAPLCSPLWKTGLRVAEQVYRRRYH